MLIAGEPIYYSESQTTVTNPVAIIEVLSDATRDYDQGRKFGFYRSVESLQEYILVEPEQLLVMIYRRGNDKQWFLHILETETDILKLESVKVEMCLQEIYEGV
jgi:Uma2 family endonuclease